jgi:ribosomal protein L37AE/L43A
MILLTTLLPRPLCRLTIKALESANRQEEEEVSMEGSTTTRFHSIRCPFCEVYELERLRDGSARCASCGGSLDAELLSIIPQILTLPEALGSHPCEECGHPEMRRLPDGVFHCPACGSEVLPLDDSREPTSEHRSQAYWCGWIDDPFGESGCFTENLDLVRYSARPTGSTTSGATALAAKLALPRAMVGFPKERSGPGEPE